MSPGGFEGAALLAWVEAVAEGGADGILLREPSCGAEAVRAAAERALALGIPVAVHVRCPEGRALAALLGVVLHLRAGASVLSLSPPGSTEEWHGSASERPAVPSGGSFAASTHGEPEVDRALAAGAVYVTLSPVWAPTSKPDDRRPTLGAQRFLAAAHGRPVLALGGVTPDRFAALMSAGAHGAAVLGPFRGEPGDVARAVAAYRAAVSGGFLSGSKTKSAS